MNNTLIVDKQEMLELAQKRQIECRPISDEDGCFQSKTISMQGMKASFWSNPATYDEKMQAVGLAPKARGSEEMYIKWEALGCERIPGLHCPYCNAQAFRTDYPGVACCGACPGWYFFYMYEESNQGTGQAVQYVFNSSGELEKVVTQETNHAEKEESGL